MSRPRPGVARTAWLRDAGTGCICGSARNAVTSDAVTTLRAGTPPRTSGGRAPGYPVVRTGRGLVLVLPRPARVRTPGCPAGTVAPVTDRAAPMSMFDYDARPVTPLPVLVGTTASRGAYAIRDFLSRNGYPFEWADACQPDAVRAVLGVAEVEPSVLPLCILPDGSRLASATVEQARRFGAELLLAGPLVGVSADGPGYAAELSDGHADTRAGSAVRRRSRVAPPGRARDRRCGRRQLSGPGGRPVLPVRPAGHASGPRPRPRRVDVAVPHRSPVGDPEC